LILEFLSLIFDSLFVGFSFSKFGFEGINLLIDNSYFLNNDLKLFCLLISSSLSLISCILEWFDFLENSVVSYNVYNPRAKECSSN